MAKTVGVVLGAAALVIGTAGLAFPAVSIAGIGSLSAIGSALGLASGIANIGSQALAKPTRQQANGTLTQVLLMADPPRPYPMGEGHFAGARRHREGYGGTVDGVPNPYWLEVDVYSGVGPVQSIEPRIDFAAVPAWYSGYLATDTQLGAMPEPSALTASFGVPARWTAAHKLSGHAAIAWNYKFDKAGKKFASGFPLTGAYGQWNLVYDPRQDSTYPGGSGPCRLGDESTYVWDGPPGDAIPAGENPWLHAGTYAYGRYVETDDGPVRVMGMGLSVEGIDFATIAAAANVAAVNEWRIFGVAWEGGESDDKVRWQNLKDICAAGGGEPGFAGAVLSFVYDAPRVAIDTVTEEDVLDARSVTFEQSWRDTIKTVVPECVSPDHNWEMTKAAGVTLPVADGTRRVWPFRFVKDPDQAAQLAVYKAMNSRELHPIRVIGMPRLRNYHPGDCLHLKQPRLGIDGPAVLLQRGPLDPATFTREMIFIGETSAKHAYALGQTATMPAAAALGQTAQERDETAAGAADKQVAVEVIGFRAFAADPAGVVTSPLPDYIVPAVTLGGQDVRTADFVRYSITTAGVTASVNDTDGDPDKGMITITAVDALNGVINLTVEVSGVAQPAKPIAVQKTTGLPSGLGGAGAKVASDSSFPDVSTTAYTTLTDVMTVTVGSGETLYGSAPLDYGISDSSSVSRTATARWRYSPAGAGTWSNFDTGDIAGTAASGGFAWEGGHGEFNDAKSGLTPGDYDVKLEVKLDAGSINVSFWGTASIEAKI